LRGPDLGRESRPSADGCVSSPGLAACYADSLLA